MTAPADAEMPARHERRIGPFTLRQIGAVGLTLVLVATGLIVLTRPIAPAAGAPLPQPNATFYRIGNATEGLAVGNLAPELTVPGPNGTNAPLLDLDGRPIRLAGLRGHPVWINFFASWCPPCQAETPTIRDVAAAYRPQGLAVIGVAVAESTAEDVRAYAQRYGLDYTIGFDATQAVYNGWRNIGIPTQYFIDADGIIRLIVKGPLADPAAARAALASIVPGLPSTPTGSGVVPGGSAGAGRISAAPSG
jgi:cytochrome c biogenesis protein CcmG, thiol:disulfide interchange protein DsbE